MVDAGGDSVTLRGREYELTLSGVTPVPAPGTRLRAGDPLADAASDRWAEIARAACRCATRAAADDRRTVEGAGWRSAATRARCSACPSCPKRDRAADLLARRDESFAQVQEHYYAEPPQIERGWRHHLMSTAGRSLPRHGQQRHGAGPRPSAGRRNRGPAAAAAEHELALQLRGGGRVQRAAGRDAARSAGHRAFW